MEKDDAVVKGGECRETRPSAFLLLRIFNSNTAIVVLKSRASPEWPLLGKIVKIQTRL